MTDHEPARSDVPVGVRLASLLAAAAAPSEPGPLPGEAAARTAFRARHVDAPRGSWHRTRAKVAVAAALGTGLLLTGGVGAAAAGSLPGAAQETASRMLAVVGVDVPGGDDRSSSHPDERGGAPDPAGADAVKAKSSPRVEEPGRTAGDAPGGAATDGGNDVSDLAVTTDALGVDKGAEISGHASGGRSQAGNHGVDEEAAEHRPEVARGDGPAAHTGADDPGPPDADRPGEARPDRGNGATPPADAPQDRATDPAGDAAGGAAADGRSSAGSDDAEEASDRDDSTGSGQRP
jgi:hypothetical protein